MFSSTFYCNPFDSIGVLLRYVFIILQLVLNRILLFQASFLILGPVVITVHYRTLLPYLNLFCVLLFIILGCSSSSLYRQLLQECDAVNSVNMNQRRKCYTFRCFCFISWSSDCLPLSRPSWFCTCRSLFHFLRCEFYVGLFCYMPYDALDFAE